ncbi:MAG: formate dehydrogenase accessory protein FdhE, partial [Thermomicrobiales bacterium]
MTLSASARRQMDTLLAAQPETGPWLGVLAAALEESANPAWDAVAGTTTLQPERGPSAPLLAGAQIPLDARLAKRWLRRLLTLAGEAGPEAASLRGAASQFPPLVLLEAAVNGDSDRLAVIAHPLAVDPDALTAVAALAAMPLLQALRRRFGPAVDPRWSEGICPLCGGWPLLAEQRGLERVRRLRCGRCGGDWTQPGIRCPYCGIAGHDARAALVPEQDGDAHTVETCRSCRGYLKRVSTLRAWTTEDVPLADLATIDLDLVALERGFTRPEPRRLSPGVRVLTPH